MTENEIPALQPPPIESKTITGYAYNHVGRKLFIEFRGTGLYCYEDVPQKIVNNMLTAPSIGKYVAKEVIPNHHCNKIPKEAI